MIEHTAILHKAPSNKEIVVNDETIDIDITEMNENDDEKKMELKPIENKDIQRMQDIAFDLFKKFTKQSHKEARDCGIQLLINLYKLEKERTFEFAKDYFVKRELIDYLKKLKKLGILSKDHKKHLDSLSSRGGRSRIRKGMKKKKKKDGSSDVKSEIKKLKKKKKKKTIKSPTATIPEEDTIDKNMKTPKLNENKSKPEVSIKSISDTNSSVDTRNSIDNGQNEDNNKITEIAI